ncbi:MAG: hypothetical protein ACI837_003586 [Crocinitomicaceae bacterium]|jgi:hypothetical protein
MRRTLLNDELEERFQKDGYVVIPFLSPDEVTELTESYFNTLEESGGRLGPDDENYDTSTEITYDFTFIDKNIDYKRKVFDMITTRFKDRYVNQLDTYKPIIANYIRKKTDGGEVPMHQNWAFVDEKKCASVSIWCPLVDSNAENGTLEVVPGSHKRYGEVRGPMIQSELLGLEKDIIDKHMVPINIEAGNAVILDDSIVHYSSPNATEGLRLAIQLILIPEEEESIHYHMDLSKDRSKVEVLSADTEFYMKFNPWKKPDESLARLRSFKYTPYRLNIQDFERKLREPRFDSRSEKKSIWKRLTGSKAGD